jgi:hypothetical protein
MNTNAPHWIDYIASFRKPGLPQAVAPTPLAVDKPQLASIRLADKIRYVDGMKVVSSQWSQVVYKVTGEAHGFVLLQDSRGVIIGRKPENVKAA